MVVSTRRRGELDARPPAVILVAKVTIVVVIVMKLATVVVMLRRLRGVGLVRLRGVGLVVVGGRRQEVRLVAGRQLGRVGGGGRAVGRAPLLQ